jgi:hypothetical protein
MQARTHRRVVSIRPVAVKRSGDGPRGRSIVPHTTSYGALILLKVRIGRLVIA